MKLVFWLCFGFTVYAYIGYVLLLRVYAHFRKLPVLAGTYVPRVSLILAARNEERNLPAKLQNLRALDYPPDRLQIIVASDGSTDETNEILRQHAPNVIAVLLDSSMGKANALNAAVRISTGEILVFLDVRQSVASDALIELVSCLADPTVGAVSGELLLESPAGKKVDTALGIYWKLEKAVRKLESATGSVVGVTGAIYAVRRELYVEIPIGTILDDVFVPMNVVRMGRRVVFQSSAVAYDRFFEEKGKEFSRKVRTLTGNYQLLRIAPWLLSSANPILIRFVSHKLLRLFVPVLLVLMLISSAAAGGTFYRAAFALQILFYMLAIAGMAGPSARRLKPIAIANTFVMLNAAAALAFYNFVKRRTTSWT